MKSLFKKSLILMTLFISSSSAFAYNSSPVEYFDFEILSDSTCAVYSFGDYARDLTIPSEITYGGKTISVTTIGNNAFQNCKSLTNITIPNSVTTIGGCAFDGCSSLTNVTIPNSVTTIGDYAFNGCLGLTNVTIPNSVTTIERGAFNDCLGLTNVTIPNSVTTIGDYAFGGCGLSSITIGTGVQSIGDYAFGAPCKIIWLTNIPPAGYTEYEHTNTIHYVANDSYKKLGNVTIYPYLSSLFEVDGIKYVPVNPSKRTCDAIDCTYDSTITVANISTTVKYKGVEFTVNEIMPYFCFNNDYLNKVSINLNGGSIGNYAFSNCDGITEAIIKAKAINNYAFTSCNRMTKVDLKETLESIGNHVFEDCTNLQEIVIPNSVTNMGISCFEGCI